MVNVNITTSDAESNASSSLGTFIGVPLLELPHALLNVVWPPERVVTGFRVCKHLHQHLTCGRATLVCAGHYGVTEQRLSQDFRRLNGSLLSLRWCAEPSNPLLKALVHSSCASKLENFSLSVLWGRESWTPLHMNNVLAQATALTRLDLSGGEGEVDQVVESFGGCRALAHLSLRKCDLGSFGAQKLAETLPGCTALSHLDLRQNPIGTKGFQSLAAVLGEVATLQSLNLSAMHVTPEIASVLSDGLRRSTALTHLDLSSTAIGVEGPGGVEALAEGLGACISLKHLDLSMAFLNEQGTMALAAALRALTALASLNLSHNDMDAEGAANVGWALQGCSGLTSLDLKNNNIEESGAQEMAWAVRVCSGLVALDLSSNAIGDEGVEELVGSLVELASLRTVDLSDNEVGLQTQARLGEAMRSAVPGAVVTWIAPSENQSPKCEFYSWHEGP